MLRQIEVCFSPAVYHRFHNPDSIVVIVDILRATSAICTAFMNGAESIIPVGTLEEAKQFKNKGYLVAAERDGIVADFADFGNSPYNFIPENIKNKTIAYSTTNGTKAINLARDSFKVAVGSFLNLEALNNWLIAEDKNVTILCSGWKDRFSLEDSIFAGALAQMLIESGHFETICDSSLAACDLWSVASNDLIGYIQKAAQRDRLRKNGLDDVIEYCFTLNQTDIIPILSGNYLVGLKYCENINNFSKKKIQVQ
jgi:2-phosphosulfolactate phosphatase